MRSSSAPIIMTIWIGLLADSDDYQDYRAMRIVTYYVFWSYHRCRFWSCTILSHRCGFCKKKLSEKYFTREDKPACAKVKHIITYYQMFLKYQNVNAYQYIFKNIMKIIAKNNTFLPALSATRKQFTSVEFASSRSPTTTSRFGQYKNNKQKHPGLANNNKNNNNKNI